MGQGVERDYAIDISALSSDELAAVMETLKNACFMPPTEHIEPIGGRNRVTWLLAIKMNPEYMPLIPLLSACTIIDVTGWNLLGLSQLDRSEVFAAQNPPHI